MLNEPVDHLLFLTFFSSVCFDLCLSYLSLSPYLLMLDAWEPVALQMFLDVCQLQITGLMVKR